MKRRTDVARLRVMSPIRHLCAAALVFVAGGAHADYCREFSMDELEAMNLEVLQREREKITDLMLAGFLDEDVTISDAEHAGCEAQGRTLDLLILAHKAEAKAAAQGRTHED